jgi:hypothetical protein
MEDVRGSLIAARRSAFAALPPSEQEAARAASVERRAHKLARIKLARLVMSLHDNGSTCDEIAAVTGRSASGVRRFAAGHGVLLSRSLRCGAEREAAP